MKKAVCLLSGGLDSAVATAQATKEGYEITALTFDYGQKHKKEINAAAKIASDLNIKEHKIIKLELKIPHTTSLIGENTPPQNRSPEEINKQKKIPSTYVPARNTIFLAIALAHAETTNSQAIYLGAHSIDYSGYPDCRPEYFKKYQQLIDIATKKTTEGDEIKIKTPLIYLNKAQIIKKGFNLDVNYKHTWSCYLGGKKACGRCDACILRKEGFKQNGCDDPLDYETK